MLIIPVKDGENIDKALKKFKRKFLETRTMAQLRDREQFTKKSVLLRDRKLKAVHTQRTLQQED